ncbi:hypothetical protein B0H17DRAFT_1077890 [Mycena rosella]|uniref:Uncharacterized protein n=1 Tax=Mycena rosella TaxID=1033263 RepID=A0AAD7G8U2_MYCRO|nr:hypothetical protein B0H17DRAFT_1077890 [Mycena rosella]
MEVCTLALRPKRRAVQWGCACNLGGASSARQLPARCGHRAVWVDVHVRSGEAASGVRGGFVCVGARTSPATTRETYDFLAYR